MAKFPPTDHWILDSPFFSHIKYSLLAISPPQGDKPKTSLGKTSISVSRITELPLSQRLTCDCFTFLLWQNLWTKSNISYFPTPSHHIQWRNKFSITAVKTPSGKRKNRGLVELASNSDISLDRHLNVEIIPWLDYSFSPSNELTSQPLFFLLHFLKFYLSMFDLQCCDNFCCTVKRFSYTYTHIHSFSNSFPK